MNRSSNFDLGSYHDLDSDSDSDEIDGDHHFSKHDKQSVLLLPDQMQTINFSILEKNSQVALKEYTDDDFFLDQMNKPFIPFTQNIIRPTEAVIVISAHPAQYPNLQSEYSDLHPCTIGWQPIKKSLPLEFPSIVQSCYKNEYQAIKSTINYHPCIAPTSEKLNAALSIRKEFAHGRILFHYIGYGFNEINQTSILLCEGRADNIRPYPFKKIFDMISQPSWFIFDCDNAGSALESLVKLTNAQKSFNDNPNIEDWFCMCATDVGEKLPADPRIPRDFLTSCLLTPIYMSIICHIIRFYRTSSDNLIQNLNNTLKNNSQSQLLLALDAITDAIASDLVERSIFKKLFRDEPMISMFFRRFLMAQYLLSSYDIHPVSNPNIPILSAHPLWNQWEANVDLWITSTTIPRPSFATDFYSRAATTLLTKLKMHNEQISSSLLTIICHIPFNELSNTYDEALSLLAEYASRSNENRKKLANSVIFSSLIAKFSLNNTTPEQFQALSYLITTLLQLNLNFVYEIDDTVNLATFVDSIFDNSINDVTRSFFAAILTSVIGFQRIIKTLCTTEEFFLSVKQLIPVASPQLLLWLFIFIKKTYDSSTATIESFYNTFVHLQIAICINHKSPEVRAASRAALSCFMQPGECPINLQIMLLVMYGFEDMSFIVRHQILLFAIRYLATYGSEYAEDAKIQRHSFLSSYRVWLNTTDKNLDLEAVIKVIDVAIHEENAMSEVASLVELLIDYYAHDPHPVIKTLALRAKTTIQEPIILPFTSYGYEPMIDEYEPNRETESDSSALYNISMRQLVNTGQWKDIPIEIPKKKRAEPYYGQIDIPTIQLSLANKPKPRLPNPVTKISYHPLTLQSVVSTKNRWIYLLDEDGETVSRTRVNEGEISDIHLISNDQEQLVISATNEGCCHVWNPNQKNFKETWRCDIKYTDKETPLNIAVSNGSNVIASVRGNSATALWDLSSQQLVGEWLDGEDANATSILFHPGNQNICYVGYDNGNLTAFDKRESYDSKIITHTLRSPILGISGNRVASDWMYIATRDGRCLSCDLSTNKINHCLTKASTTTGFSAHFALPLFGFTSANDYPIIASSNGQFNYSAKTVPIQSVLAFHPILPVVKFGTSEGDIFTYNILLVDK